MKKAPNSKKKWLIKLIISMIYVKVLKQIVSKFSGWDFLRIKKCSGKNVSSLLPRRN